MLKLLTRRLVVLTLLFGTSGSVVQAQAPFDTDSNGIHIDDLVKHIQTNGLADVNQDGLNNRWDVSAMLAQVSPVSTEHAVTTGTVTGLAVDQTGLPLAQLAVALNGTTTSAYTDTEGRYTITDVAASTGNVVTSAVYGAESAPFAVLAGQTTSLRAPLQVTLPTGTVTGTVYNADMIPMSGVTVTLGIGSSVSEPPTSTVTDSQGRFSMANVPVGQRSFYASSPLGFTAFGVNVQEGANDTSTIIGAQYVTVTGIAYDSHYTPLADAQITMVTANGNLVTTTTSAADGTFSFSNAVKGMTFTWHMSKQGYMDAAMTLMASSPTDVHNRYFLTVSDTPVRTDHDLAYAAGVNVDRFNVDLGGYAGPVRRSYSTYSYLISERLDEPNNQIAFVGDLDRLNAALLDPTVSTIYVYQSIAGTQPREIVSPSRPVSIVSGTDRFVQATLPAASSLSWTNVRQVDYGDIFGFVRSFDNQTVIMASVQLSGASTATTYTDGSGFYRFKDLSFGTYTLTASRSGQYAPQSFTVDTNAAPFFLNFSLEYTAQQIAHTMEIPQPAAGQQQLAMPAVPSGYTVAIDSSNDVLKISPSGAITLGATTQYVTVIFRVTHGSDVGYRSATITVPGYTGS
ncbi:carboxypeptidase regulatory-like domain-containing protein [Bacillus sp. 3255]|uniref:carboxypeptidase regulatory-like domain-containing protein n=1 Tax=Bacillus sp. 3255 TaxID=2817904 RepID=UPI002864CCD0|nr:carboxypeptidase regulatory-like domain-containing protein [Bacillus sp. 3255]MDR6878524.1 hypothetical protein [Bacillus sp. 3255]